MTKVKDVLTEDQREQWAEKITGSMIMAMLLDKGVSSAAAEVMIKLHPVTGKVSAREWMETYFLPVKHADEKSQRESTESSSSPSR